MSVYFPRPIIEVLQAPSTAVVERFCIGHTRGVNKVKFTSDGKYCLSASDDKTIRLWNHCKDDPAYEYSDSKPLPNALHIMTYAGFHNHPVYDVAVFDNNSKIGSAGGDKLLFITDIGSCDVVRRITAHDHRINALDTNMDGTVLVSGSYDRTVKAWDLRSNSRDPIQLLSDFTDSVTSVKVTDSQIIAGCVDGNVRIYDLRAGKLFTDTLSDPITHITCTNDNKCSLAMCMGGKIKLIENASGVLLQEFCGGHEHKRFKTECAMFNDDKTVICGSEDGSICYYNLISASVIQRTDMSPFRKYGMILKPPLTSSTTASSLSPYANMSSSSQYPQEDAVSLISTISVHPRQPRLLVGMSTGVVALLNVNL